MGCSSSSTKVAPIKQKDDGTNGLTEMSQSKDTSELEREMHKAYVYLTNRVHTIRFPSGMVPILVLSQPACPLYLSKMEFALEKSEIYMPIIAYNCDTNSNIICFSHYMVLANSYFRSEDDKTLIQNCFQLLFGQNNHERTVFFIGFPEHIQSEITNHMALISYKAKFGTFDDDWEQYKVLAITSSLPIYDDVDKTNRLTNYLNKGNGLACFYDSTESLLNVPINQFLSKYGMSYAYCQLISEMKPSPIHKTPKEFFALTNITFDELCSKLEFGLEKGSSINATKLDSLVTNLRYYVMVCQKEQLPKLKEILQKSFDFLEKTKYRDDNKIAFKTYQTILIILLIEIFRKIPTNEITISKDADLFPGLVENMQLSDFTVALRCRPQSLISTGVWCQPGVYCSIECDNAPENLEIQIGSHSSILVTKPGPWHRWPDITTTYKLEKGQTNVASSFGGIVYILNGGTSSFDIELKFHDFAKYTRIVPQKPEVYENTKCCNAPMCEIMLQTIIFTLPRSFLSNITDMSIFQKIDDLILKVAKCAYYTIERPYRIVFDTDLTEKLFVSKYPIVLHIDDLTDIFASNLEINGGLFKMLMAIAVSSLPENCFDSETEKSLGAFIASSAIIQIKPDFDPLTFFDVDLPLLGQYIWAIHISLNQKMIPTILSEAQKMEITDIQVPEDLWINFVEKLCQLSHYNLSKRLGAIRPLPMNVMSEMEEMPLPPDKIFS